MGGNRVSRGTKKSILVELRREEQKGRGGKEQKEFTRKVGFNVNSDKYQNPDLVFLYLGYLFHK